MVEYDEEHGSRAEENGQTVELVVGNHLCRRIPVLGVLVGKSSKVLLEKPRNGNIDGV